MTWNHVFGYTIFFEPSCLFLCAIWRCILYHIDTLRRDEHLFLSRQQILECLHTGRCIPVCAANMCLGCCQATTVFVKYPPLVCSPLQNPVLDVSSNGHLWFIKPALLVAVCVGYPCDTKSKLVMGCYLLGCKEKFHTEPWQYNLLVLCHFISQVGRQPRGTLIWEGLYFTAAVQSPATSFPWTLFAPF